jgi:hypothetical protein
MCLANRTITLHSDIGMWTFDRHSGSWIDDSPIGNWIGDRSVLALIGFLVANNMTCALRPMNWCSIIDNLIADKRLVDFPSTNTYYILLSFLSPFTHLQLLVDCRPYLCSVPGWIDCQNQSRVLGEVLELKPTVLLFCTLLLHLPVLRPLVVAASISTSFMHDFSPNIT